jgi:hydroxymethylglutaryl-CoA lyase
VPRQSSTGGIYEMTLPSHVKLVEVSPRDGLQNISPFIPTDIKIALIEKLADTGLTTIEATSFVSPAWVPQLADHAAVFQGIRQRAGVSYPVLVPNLQGMRNAIAAGVQEIALFAAASDTFSQKNIHCSIADSLIRFEEIMHLAKAHHMKVRGYVSCALGCPYEGEIQPEKVVHLASQLFALGCYEISLGDTIGVGTPGKAVALVRAAAQKIPLSQLAVHFHDTYGQALANIYASLEEGISIVDSAVAGLGGCPYAPGAAGNVATETVLYMLDGLGIHTGVNLKALREVVRFVQNRFL